MADALAERAYEPVIGLEIHVQLSTRTKMFCGCELSFGEEPNTRTCPVCLGLPGTLPVINAEAVHFGLMIGMALGCEPAPRSIFHRKNYFYPDLPKGYQISQYDIPLARDGRLGEIRIHRVHLEEDAAKLVHAGASGRIHGAEASRVDFNRGGTPLVEIVTEPDVRSASQAAEWLRLLRVTLRQLGVSDVNMEEGSLRCDANVSIRPLGEATLGTKTELKNMNSFRFLEKGVNAEIARQEELLRGGGAVGQETLHFDPRTGALSPLRSKEEAHDYRYFPEPDLVPVAPTEEMLERARSALPELPAQRAERLERDFGLAPDTARLLAFRSDLGDFFERAAGAGKDGDSKAIANWVVGELVANVGDADPADTKVEPAALARLVAMVGEGVVAGSAAKEVMATLVAEGGDPAEIVETKGLGAAGADELAGIVAEAMAEQADAVEKIRAGNEKAIGAVMGVVMRATKGRADGAEVQRLIRERL
ncbi:MAG: Asp-tRNA(Asn)/Glu-tRNA(Gln) amidotransferase subunit GatB [Actinomycetota bacterium]|nr:Asp-tRNA(Asn)/Glu-tRNA(Gln) amidotransferase subunit GatB [Actinomycetota bacterium]